MVDLRIIQAQSTPSGTRTRYRDMGDGTHALVIATAPASGPVEADDYVSQYLLNGVSNDMGVNGSVTPATFSYTPPAGQRLSLGRLLLYMEAGGNFSSTNFMNIAALTNGVLVQVNGTVFDTWQDNIDTILSMFDLANAGLAFSNERRSLSGRWSFFKASEGANIELGPGETVSMVIQDDLSAAGIIFRAKIQGVLEDIVTP